MAKDSTATARRIDLTDDLSLSRIVYGTWRLGDADDAEVGVREDADGLLERALVTVGVHGVTVEQIHAIRVHDQLLCPADTRGLVTECADDALVLGHVGVVERRARDCGGGEGERRTR